MCRCFLFFSEDVFHDTLVCSDDYFEYFQINVCFLFISFCMNLRSVRGI